MLPMNDLCAECGRPKNLPAMEIVKRRALRHKVTVAQIFGKSRLQEVVRARHGAIRDLSEQGNMQTREIARFLGVHENAVWRAIHPEGKTK